MCFPLAVRPNPKFSRVCGAKSHMATNLSISIDNVATIKGGISRIPRYQIFTAETSK